jgi:hypothetical protein
VKFSGFDESSTLIGIMGIQDVRDVTLIRHAYVLPVHQGRRIGGALCSRSWRSRRRAHCWSAHGPRLIGQSVSTSDMVFGWSRRPRRTDFSVPYWSSWYVGFMGESEEIPQRGRRDRFSHV